MLRRDARLRKEFLYRKSLEEKEKKLYDQKNALQKALDSNQPLPRDLRANAADLTEALAYDHDLVQTDSIDDEYSQAGLQDPKIIVTTSRDPSSRLIQFAKEMRLMIPNAQIINRGNHVIKDITTSCRNNDVTDLVIIHEHRGVPDGMIISHFPHGPTTILSLSNVVLRHDIPEVLENKVSEAYPHLIFSNFTSNIGKRTQNVLKYLFPVPKEDSKRTISFINNNDTISFRHHNFIKSGKDNVEITEVGPRFEMKLFQIKLGTVEVNDADVEWVLKPYMNTSKKRNIL